MPPSMSWKLSGTPTVTDAPLDHDALRRLCDAATDAEFVAVARTALPALLDELTSAWFAAGSLQGTAQAYWAEALELRNARKQRDEARAALARYVPARSGLSNRGLPLWRHSCGNVEAGDEGRLAAIGGGCDACESGSPDASEWQPLYVREGTDRG